MPYSTWAGVQVTAVGNRRWPFLPRAIRKRRVMRSKVRFNHSRCVANGVARTVRCKSIRSLVLLYQFVIAMSSLGGHVKAEKVMEVELRQGGDG